MSATTQQETVPPKSDAAGAVSLRSVTKTFGDFTAVKDLELDVEPGEFVSMLGPSGSGKTTVLRMIAGFEETTSGQILLGGQDVTETPPFKRAVNTVFQDYALFPHMTIAKNVGYGLKVRGERSSETASRMKTALEQVRLDHVADRLPHQLSGGQRQRIALARALILRPQVLLLDEPLGALDKQLREQMQIELKQIQREVGITFIFVTHDQEEALTLSDRVAVFNNGKIEQVGTAREVYEFPQTEFVARFLGLSNILPADVTAELMGTTGVASIRPERLELSLRTATAAAGDVAVDGVIAETVYTGPSTRYIVDARDDLRLIVEQHNTHHPTADAPFTRGDSVRVSWRSEHAAIIPSS